MTEYFRAIDGGSGVWAVDGEDVYFLDLSTGRWSVSAHTAKQLRGWTARRMLRKSDSAPPFAMTLSAAS